MDGVDHLTAELFSPFLAETYSVISAKNLYFTRMSKDSYAQACNELCHTAGQRLLTFRLNLYSQIGVKPKATSVFAISDDIIHVTGNPPIFICQNIAVNRFAFRQH